MAGISLAPGDDWNDPAPTWDTDRQRLQRPGVDDRPGPPQRNVTHRHRHRPPSSSSTAQATSTPPTPAAPTYDLAPLSPSQDRTAKPGHRRLVNPVPRLRLLDPVDALPEPGTRQRHPRARRRARAPGRLRDGPQRRLRRQRRRRQHRLQTKTSTDSTPSRPGSTKCSTRPAGRPRSARSSPATSACRDTVYAPRSTVLSVIQDAADAEFPDVANVYISGPREAKSATPHPGSLTFHGRFARFNPEGVQYDIRPGSSATTHAAAADDDTVRICRPWSRRSTTRCSTRRRSRPNSNIADADIAGQYVTDTAAVDGKGVRTWSAENLLTAAGDDDRTAVEETKLFADYVVDNYATPGPGRPAHRQSPPARQLQRGRHLGAALRRRHQRHRPPDNHAWRRRRLRPRLLRRRHPLPGPARRRHPLRRAHVGRVAPRLLRRPRSTCNAAEDPHHARPRPLPRRRRPDPLPAHRRHGGATYRRPRPRRTRAWSATGAAAKPSGDRAPTRAGNGRPADPVDATGTAPRRRHRRPAHRPHKTTAPSSSTTARTGISGDDRSDTDSRRHVRPHRRLHRRRLGQASHTPTAARGDIVGHPATPAPAAGGSTLELVSHRRRAPYRLHRRQRRRQPSPTPARSPPTPGITSPPPTTAPPSSLYVNGALVDSRRRRQRPPSAATRHRSTSAEQQRRHRRLAAASTATVARARRLRTAPSPPAEIATHASPPKPSAPARPPTAGTSASTSDRRRPATRQLGTPDRTEAASPGDRRPPPTWMPLTTVTGGVPELVWDGRRRTDPNPRHRL